MGNLEHYEDIKTQTMEIFDKYMERYPDTRVRKLQLDEDEGKYIYKIKGFDDQNEYELKMDSVDGEIIEEKTKTRNDSDSYEEITKANVEKVEALVLETLNEVGQDGEFEEWTLKKKDGKAILEVEIDREGLDDLEYKYDVESGKLLQIDD